MPPLANPTELAHAHLLLNHVPTVGAVFGIAVLLLSWMSRSEHLRRLGLEVFFVIALVALPVYLTGAAAQVALGEDHASSVATVAAHRDAALAALLLIELMGFASWLALWQTRQLDRPTPATMSVVYVLAVLSLIAVARAANVGGGIRHPEIVSVAAPIDASNGWMTSAAVADFVLENRWVWSASETLHFLGMALMAGVLLTVNCRLLGGMRTVPFSAIHRLLPLAVLGFTVNVVTGMLFFVAAPEQYTSNIAMHWKVVFLELAGLNVLVLTGSDHAFAATAGATPSVRAKVLAGAVLGLFVGVTYFGRMLAFASSAF